MELQVKGLIPFYTLSYNLLLGSRCSKWREKKKAVGLSYLVSECITNASNSYRLVEFHNSSILKYAYSYFSLYVLKSEQYSTNVILENLKLFQC